MPKHDLSVTLITRRWGIKRKGLSWETFVSNSVDIHASSLGRSTFNHSCMLELVLTAHSLVNCLLLVYPCVVPLYPLKDKIRQKWCGSHKKIFIFKMDFRNECFKATLSQSSLKKLKSQDLCRCSYPLSHLSIHSSSLVICIPNWTLIVISEYLFSQISIHAHLRALIPILGSINQPEHPHSRLSTPSPSWVSVAKTVNS